MPKAYDEPLDAFEDEIQRCDQVFVGEGLSTHPLLEMWTSVIVFIVSAAVCVEFGAVAMKYGSDGALLGALFTFLVCKNLLDAIFALGFAMFGSFLQFCRIIGVKPFRTLGGNWFVRRASATIVGVLMLSVVVPAIYWLFEGLDSTRTTLVARYEASHGKHQLLPSTLGG